jgi:hypothetical protein
VSYRWRDFTGMSFEQATVLRWRLSALLAPWRGTPYMCGQQKEGMGVDCVRFVCAVLDDLSRRPRQPVKSLPNDAALHSRGGAIVGMRLIRRLYMPNDPVRDGILEPGDTVVVQHGEGGGPGHALIVGPDRGTLWHSVYPSVCTTGFGFLANTRVYRVYRMRSRESFA